MTSFHKQNEKSYIAETLVNITSYENELIKKLKNTSVKISRQVNVDIVC